MKDILIIGKQQKDKVSNDPNTDNQDQIINDPFKFERWGFVLTQVQKSFVRAL